MTTDLLKILAQEFLKTYGYRSEAVSSNGVLYSRPGGLGVADELLVYFHSKGKESQLEEKLAALAAKFDKIPSGAQGRRFCLSNEPLVGTVLATIDNKGFRYQVPVWFFDRDLSAADRRTPVKSLDAEARKYEQERIPQPFELENVRGNDLLPQLQREMLEADGPALRLIIAPAGYGKSVLMNSLYTRLADDFGSAKQRQTMGKRPLMMLPGHIERAESVDGLINNFIGREYDYGIAHRDTFRFWINQGFAVWLLDGLEELILKIQDEFLPKVLEDYLFAANSKNPQIVISIREPLLATSPELKQQIEEYQRGLGIKVYRLVDWADEQKVNYFTKNLRLPADDIGTFISEVKTQPVLANLCNVPYYCRLIADLKNEGRLAIFNDETELVEHAFQTLCEREFGKGLNEELCPVQTQKELFSVLALETYKRKGETTKQELHEWAETALPSNLAPDVQRQQLASLERHAGLALSGEYIGFTQDILYQYLLAAGLVNELNKIEIVSFDPVEIEPDSFTFRYLVKHAVSCDWNGILGQLHNVQSAPQSDANGFRNVLKIYLAIENANKETEIKKLVTCRNLSGLRFRNLNLPQADFQSSKLHSASFENCDLTLSKLNGCIFRETFISDTTKLNGAAVRGAVLESIRTDRKFLSEQKEIATFFYERTLIPQSENKGPCQAAINLKRIFEKLLRKGKGYKMPRTFLLNTKCGGGMEANKIIEELVRNDYFIAVDEYLRIPVKEYDSVAAYVGDFQLTDGISKILNSTCEDARTIGCTHIYGTAAMSRLEKVT